MPTRCPRLLALLFLVQLAFPAAADDKGRAAEFMIKELESLNQLSPLGRLLYKEDDKDRDGLEYCTDSMRFAEDGEFRQALREASKSFYLGGNSGKSYVKSIGIRNMALAYSYANDLVNAERMAKIIITDYSNEGLQVIAPAYKVMGDVRLRQARYTEAIEFYTKGQKSSPSWMSRMFLASLARTYALTQQYDKARLFYEQASENADIKPESWASDRLVGTFGKPGAWLLPSLLRGRAELAYLQGKHDEAIALYDSIKEVDEGDAYQQVWVHAGKARALWAKGSKPAALMEMNQAITLVETLRAQFRSEEIKIGLFSNLQDVLDEAIDMYMAQGQPEQAFRISEKSRARTLLDMVRNRVSLSSGSAVFSDPTRNVADLKQIQAVLPANTAMVVYHSNPLRTYAWVIRKDDIKSFTVPETRTSLEQKIRQFRVQIIQRDNITASSQALYQLLIQPLSIKKNENIVVVPHKALHFLPFQALQSSDGFLIETNQIRQAPSASLLALKKPSAPLNKQFLGLGNPKLSSPQYDLPGAQTEVETIAQLFSAPRVYVREKATRKRVTEEAPSSQILHIAAHAEMDEVDPLYSRILLSQQGEKMKDKDLEAKDIYHMDLHNTALVVLSACSSGLGNVTGGDEIIGFTRSFISAGASQVVVSLWDVEDNSTAALMKMFYQSAQKVDLATAMQQAQRTLLKDPQTRHPYFWAAFNLVGTL